MDKQVVLAHRLFSVYEQAGVGMAGVVHGRQDLPFLRFCITVLPGRE
jgi:hypothetical protein